METTDSAPAQTSRWSRSDWLFAALFVALGLLSCARYLPFELTFNSFLFLDQGWPLVVDSLIDDGLVPTIDFGYFYGLLAIVIDRGWYALFGRTPEASTALTGVGTFLILVGMTRFAIAVGMGMRGRILLICALPIAIPMPFPTPLHALEAALLVNALAFQARRQLQWALVLVVLAVFLKPGLAYFYGFFLGISVLAGWGGISGSFKQRCGHLIPAMIALMFLIVGLSLRFGWQPLINTQLPFDARQVYQDDNYGFFKEGKGFWQLSKGKALMYVISPVGFWLLSSVILWLASLRRLSMLRSPEAFAIVMCGLLHAIFVFALFGNKWSWLYYPMLLVCGFVAAVQHRRIANLFAVLALLSTIAPFLSSLQYSSKVQVQPSMANLYGFSEEVSVWGRVAKLAEQERVFVLSQTSGVQQIYPNIHGPKSWFLLRGSVKPGDIARTQSELQQAAYIVVPHGEAGRPSQWPEFAAEMAKFTKVAEGPSFMLLQRKPE